MCTPGGGTGVDFLHSDEWAGIALPWAERSWIDLMLATLRTLKIKSPLEQLETVRGLARANVGLYESLTPLLLRDHDDSIFETKLRRDKQTILQVALLAVVAADMACVRHSRRREAHKHCLRWLCAELGVELALGASPRGRPQHCLWSNAAVLCHVSTQRAAEPKPRGPSVRARKGTLRQAPCAREEDEGLAAKPFWASAGTRSSLDASRVSAGRATNTEGRES